MPKGLGSDGGHVLSRQSSLVAPYRWQQQPIQKPLKPSRTLSRKPGERGESKQTTPSQAAQPGKTQGGPELEWPGSSEDGATE